MHFIQFDANTRAEAVLNTVVTKFNFVFAWGRQCLALVPTTRDNVLCHLIVEFVTVNILVVFYSFIVKYLVPK